MTSASDTEDRMEDEMTRDDEIRSLKLDKLDRSEPCVKCGGLVFTVKHQHERYGYYSHALECAEHLEVTCSCGHQWAAAPLDSGA